MTQKFEHPLNLKNYREQVRGSASGATVRHTAPERIYKCEVVIPESLEVQKKVASTLSNYDDLIQTNQQRIALLEEAAQRLYDEWFVKLRFPNHEQVPVVDGVPEGWERVTFAFCFPCYVFCCFSCSCVSASFSL